MAGRGNLTNLTPWKKGQSGNPKGRPSLPFREWLKTLEPSLQEVCGRVLTDRRVNLPMRFRAAQDLADRLYGKARETVQVEGEQQHTLILPQNVWERFRGRESPDKP
jgi:Family of unknown function (DUF5681)